MDLINLLILCAFVTNLFLSILIHLRSVKTKANVTFEITAFGVTAWCLAMALYRVSDLTFSMIWLKLLYFFPLFIPSGFLVFGLFFPKDRVNKIAIGIIVVLTVAMSTLTLFGNGVVRGIILNPGFEKKIIFGWAYYWLYIFFIPGFFLTSFVVLFAKFLKGSPLIKVQILYILLGSMLSSSFAVITNLYLPTIGYFELNWLGQLCTVLWIGGVTYAIIKHRLIDVRFVVARSLVYVLLVGIIAAFYTGTVFVIGNSFFTGKTDINQVALYAFLTIFVAFTFQPLKYFLEKVTDRIFFKNNYNSNELLSRLTKILATNLKLEDITRKTLSELFDTMHISRGVFYIFHNNNLIQSVSGGFEEKEKHNENMILKLCKKKEMMILEEVDNEENEELMRKLNASVALPLYVGDEMHGILLLGEKKSGDIYFNKDIEVLKIFGPEVSVALENSKAYEEIRKFNITLKKEVDKATKDLQNANIKLQQLDKLKDEFVSLASHELRTPMTVIKSYLWLMLSKNNVGTLSEKQKMYVSRAYTSTQRLINLVNDMLNVSRIESGRFTMDMKPIDLVDLVNTIHGEMLPKAQEQKINFEFARPLQPLPKVQADPERIEQVLINLIGNSLKFTAENGTVRIAIEHDPQTQQEIVSITDNGRGIDVADIQKLFQKFSMVGTNYLVKQNAQGTGLGLYLSKSIVGLMGGTIWAESAGLGKGSKFSFTLKTV
jgi:signal transduction histidine kinase